MALDRNLSDRWMDLTDPEENRILNMKLAVLLLVHLEDANDHPTEAIAYMQKRVRELLDRAGV